MSARLAMWTLAIATVSPWVSAGEQLQPDDWPQFRGPRAAGVAAGQYPPARWDIAAGTNVRWKTPIPGLGHASPVIAGERLFIVTAVGSEENPGLQVGLYGDIRPVPDEGTQAWRLYCLRRQTGEILWERTLHEAVPAIKRHTKATHANSTPATNGQYVAVFLGSEGLYCYDVCGRLIWKKDLGVLDAGYYVVPGAQWGFGSSPIIYQDMVIIQCDVQKDSFLASFDIRTGHELWRTAREDVPTWSTPTIYEGARSQLIVNGCRQAGGYDPWTGQELWRLSGGGDIPVPTPIVGEDLIFLTSAHGWLAPLCAVRADAEGEIKVPAESGKRNLAWHKSRDGIYMQTPLFYEGLLYACRDSGVLSCYEATTGKRLYRERLGGGVGFTASPVAADGKIYFTSEDGEIFVVRAGSTYELLARNSMGEICMATPAITADMLIIRGEHHVYGIGEPDSPACGTIASNLPKPSAVLAPAKAAGRTGRCSNRRRGICRRCR